MTTEQSVDPILISSQKQSSVSRVLHYLNQNYAENVSLDELSKTLHLNKYYICHSFKETTGYTISLVMSYAGWQRPKAVAVYRCTDFVYIRDIRLQYTCVFQQSIQTIRRCFSAVIP